MPANFTPMLKRLLMSPAAKKMEAHFERAGLAEQWNEQRVMTPELTGRINAYLQFRANGNALNGHLLDALTDDDAKQAGLCLGLWEDNQLVYEDEKDMEYHADFCIHELRDKDGKTAVRRYREMRENLPETDIAILEAKIAARTSLYEVIHADPFTATVTLHDMLKPEIPPVTITDMGMSRTLQVNKQLLFTRIVKFSKFNAISGVSCLFRKRDYKTIRKTYDKLSKQLPSRLSVAEKRYIAFFRLNHGFGDIIHEVKPANL